MIAHPQPRDGKILVGGQEYERHVAHHVHDPPAELGAVQPGHHQIGYDHVRLLFERQLEALFAAVRNARKLQIKLLPWDQLFQTQPNLPVVVHNDDPAHGGRLLIYYSLFYYSMDC